MTRVLLTGATGFVGRHIVPRLLADSRVSSVRCLAFRQIPAIRDDRLEVVRGDLADPASLNGLTEGVDAVLHVAGHVGEDASICRGVNAVGTKTLCDMAQGTAWGRFLYVSNAAVYGWASHAGAGEDDVEVAPATPTSRSRAEAEQYVLGVDGTVIRPLFVYGDGDTRFVPLLSRALARSPVMVGGGRARVSAIAVEELARALVELCLDPDRRGLHRVFHANDQRPVSLREIAEVLHRSHGVRIPRWSVPYPVARLMLRMFRPSAMGTSGWNSTAAHRLFLMSRDHWYDASRLWNRLGWQPSGSLLTRMGAAAE